MIRKVGIKVPNGLLHIYMFIEMTSEKYIFEIMLINGLFVGHNKRENNTDYGGLGDKTKSVSVVQIRYLCVALGNKMSFEMFNRFVRKIFGLKHPFGFHNVGIGRLRNKNILRTILRGLNFFFHGGKPSRIFQSRFKSFRISGEPTSPRCVRCHVLNMSVMSTFYTHFISVFCVLVCSFLDMLRCSNVLFAHLCV